MEIISFLYCFLECNCNRLDSNFLMITTFNWSLLQTTFDQKIIAASISQRNAYGSLTRLQLIIFLYIFALFKQQIISLQDELSRKTQLEFAFHSLGTKVRSVSSVLRSSSMQNQNQALHVKVINIPFIWNLFHFVVRQ